MTSEWPVIQALSRKTTGWTTCTVSRRIRSDAGYLLHAFANLTIRIASWLALWISEARLGMAAVVTIGRPPK
jgi:hypothetical protein